MRVEVATGERHSERRGGVAAGLAAAAFVLGVSSEGLCFAVVAIAIEASGGGQWLLATLALVRLVPYVALAATGGAIAARRSARRVLTVAAGGQLAAAVGVGVAVGSRSVVAGITAAGLGAVANCASYPAMMRSVCERAPARHRERHGAAGAALASIAFVGGPGLGGLLASFGSTVAVVAAVAVAAASGGVALLVPPPAVSRTEFDDGVGDGAWSPTPGSSRRLLTGAALRRPVAAALGTNVLVGGLGVVAVRLPTELGFGGEREFGLLNVAGAVGAVLALALVASAAVRRHSLVAVVVAGVAVAGCVAGNLWIALAGALLLGTATMTVEVAASAQLCHAATPRQVAAAIGVLDAWMVTAVIVGTLIASAIVAGFGLVPALLVLGLAVPPLTALAARTGGATPTVAIIQPHPVRGDELALAVSAS